MQCDESSTAPHQSYADVLARQREAREAVEVSTARALIKKIPRTRRGIKPRDIVTFACCVLRVLSALL
nr:MAG TPA: hypothetical protein [Caudoviricetes sp.]